MEYCIIAFKEVGKDITFLKIKNSIKEFEKMVGGEIETTKYEGFTIVYRKENKYLRPNIYLEGTFFSLGYSIRGPLLVINYCDEEKYYYSLTKEQALKCRELFFRKQYHYNDIYKKYKNNSQNFKNKERFPNPINIMNSQTSSTFISNQSRCLNKNNSNNPNSEKDISDIENMLQLILNIQTTILNFIKRYSE